MERDILRKPTALTLTAVAILGRLLPHPANFTPIGASALFGGAKLSRPWNYLAPLFVLFVTDLIIGFHGTMSYVYLSIIAAVFLGEKLLKQNSSTPRVAITSLVSATVFFLVTNFGVWAEGLLYPKTLDGLMQSYVMALPFFRNMILADLLFSTGFFAVYNWAERYRYVEKLDQQIRVTVVR